MDQLVEAATAEIRQGAVDYGKNLEICDCVGRDPSEALALVAAVKRRLGKNDAHVQLLALTLLEMCVKNCETCHGAVESILSSVANLAQSPSNVEVQTRALELIQQWGVAFEPLKQSYPKFCETYYALRVKGLPFGDPSDIPVFTPPRTQPSLSNASESDAALAAALADGSLERANAIVKVRTDLDVVAEHVSLLESMLPNSPGIREDEAMSEVVGFLEACRPRLANLVEVGLAGGLGDADTVAHLLAVNDAVQQVLADEAASENRPPPAPQEETLLDLSAPPPPAPPAAEGSLLDFTAPPVAAAPPAAAPAPAEESLLDFTAPANPTV